MINKRMRNSFFTTVSSAAILATVGVLPAFADDEAEEQIIEEVIVTATKREVSLQDTSLAITAYSGEQLDNRGVRDLMDIASAVPGVDASDVAPGKGTLIFRGLSVVTTGIGRGSVNHQQTNISYLDDIVLFPGITPIELIDVERVEVLKGPQGTLFGKSAMAGVARYISNAPEISVFTGEATVGAESVASGSNGGGVEGFVNIPVGDNAALRVVGWQHDAPGFIDIVGPFKHEDANDVTTTGFRLRGLWNVSDALTLEAQGLTQEVDIGDVGQPTPTWVPSTEEDPHALVLARMNPDDPAAMYREPGSTKDTILSFKASYEAEDYTVMASGSELDGHDIFHKETSDGCGHGDYNWCSATIIGGLSPNGLPHTFKETAGPNFRDIEAFELRITSTTDSMYEWIVGFWSEDNKHRRAMHWFWDTQDRAYLEAKQAVALANAPLDSEGRPWLANADADWTLGCTTGQRGESVDIASGQYFHERFTTNNVSERALFGELGVNFTDQLKFTAGVRVARLRTEFAKNNGRFGPCWYDNDESEGDRLSPWQDVKTYRLNLDYHMSDDVMLFAFAASGYRPAGSNFYSGKEVEDGPLVYALQDFKSDSVWNYEAGIRSVSNDGRLILNGSFYRIDWKDMQTMLDGPRDLAAQLGWVWVYTEGRYLGNIGKSRIHGLEGMAVVNVNPELNVTFNISYKDTEILADKRANLVGKNLAGSSAGDFQYSFLADWARRINDFDVRVNATYRHVPERVSGYSDLNGQTPIPSYDTMDLSIGVGRDAWEVALNVHNLFDERGYTHQPVGGGVWPNPNGNANWLDRFALYDVIRPRTVGLELTYNFGN